jgi:hypothetical protein
LHARWFGGLDLNQRPSHVAKKQHIPGQCVAVFSTTLHDAAMAQQRIDQITVKIDPALRAALERAAQAAP